MTTILQDFRQAKGFKPTFEFTVPAWPSMHQFLPLCKLCSFSRNGAWLHQIYNNAWKRKKERKDNDRQLYKALFILFICAVRFSCRLHSGAALLDVWKKIVLQTKVHTCMLESWCRGRSHVFPRYQVVFPSCVCIQLHLLSRSAPTWRNATVSWPSHSHNKTPSSSLPPASASIPPSHTHKLNAKLEH